MPARVGLASRKLTTNALPTALQSPEDAGSFNNFATLSGKICGGRYTLQRMRVFRWCILQSVSNGGRLQSALTNWRLVLLGATGIILSVASGWTTWDGMRNFTNEPILSLMITFGIQGVMLIAAWLIGESFAIEGGGRQHADPAFRSRRFQATLGRALGIFLFLAVLLLIANHYGLFNAELANWTTLSPGYFSLENILWGVIAITLTGLLVLNAGREFIDDHLRALRVVTRNTMLWIMFLACMATSVFFSFDSLFSNIFPEEERGRAADVRIRNEVAGVTNDIIRLTAQTKLRERGSFFSSSTWQRYAGTLDQLASDLQNSPDVLDRALEDERQLQRREEARNHSALSAAANKRTQISARRAELDLDYKQTKKQAAELAEAVKTLNQKIFKLDSKMIAKAAAADAEARGVGTTARRGRGPIYRALIQEHERIQATKESLELELQAYTPRLEQTRKAVENAAVKIAAVEAEMLEFNSQDKTANPATDRAERITRLTATKTEALSKLEALRTNRIAFEQAPTRGGLDQLQARCTDVATLLLQSPDLSTTTDNSACDPGQAHETAAQLYALNNGTVTLKQTCGQGKTLPDGVGIEAQLAFARGCLHDSRLSGAAAASIRSDLGALEQNRDDKAHRFVVTTNAFSDKNRLAYLALAIALAIDSLVFISGLFGANALRSPLSSIPHDERRTAQQLNAIVANTLQPDPHENAMAVLELAQPIADGEHPEFGRGWTHEINLDAVSQMAKLSTLRRILNAGSTIGAVKRDPAHAQHYALRGELIEFLNGAAAHHATAAAAHNANGDLPELKTFIKTSLGADVYRHADTVLKYLHPTSEKPGFSSQVIMHEIKRDDLDVVRQCLNAASVLDAIDCIGAKGKPKRVLVSKDLYRVLLSLAADFAPTQQAAPQQIVMGQPPATEPERDGLQLESTPDKISRRADPNLPRRQHRKATTRTKPHTQTIIPTPAATAEAVLAVANAPSMHDKHVAPEATTVAASTVARRQPRQQTETNVEPRPSEHPEVATAEHAEPGRWPKVSISDDAIKFD